jgi:hypothetical protein
VDVMKKLLFFVLVLCLTAESRGLICWLNTFLTPMPATVSAGTMVLSAQAL